MFVPGHERAKRTIVARILAIKPQLQNFAADTQRGAHEITGFFVECCARFSCSLPKNTPRAQQYAQTLITYLKERGLSNPDHIWIAIRGKRITISAIGEVKSHPSALIHRPLQSTLQEHNIHMLMKDQGIRDILATTSRVVLGSPFNRYMIFPRSTNGQYRLPLSVPHGWQIKELEFSLSEISLLVELFLEEEKNRVSCDYPHDLYAPFIDTMRKRTESVVTKLFSSVPDIQQDTIMHNALVTWVILFQNVPTNRETIDRIVTWTRGLPCTGNILFPFLATPPMCHGQLRLTDKKSYEALTRRFPQVPHTLVIAVLNSLAHTKKRLPKRPAITKKKDIDFFSLL